MLKPSRLRGHGREGRLLAQPTGLEVGPVERSGEYAKACADECEQNDLGGHRSNSVWLINATLHDLGLSDFDLDQNATAARRRSGRKTPAIEPYPTRYGLTNSFARSTVAFGVA